MFDAIVRLYGAGEWRTMTAAALVAALNAPAALAKMTLEQFFAAVVNAGGAPAELAKLWGYQQYVIWANDALNAGDYNRTQALLSTMPETLGETTQAAIATVLTAATLPAIARYWPTDTGAPAAPVTEQGVVDALAAAGYTWTGAAWVATQ